MVLGVATPHAPQVRLTLDAWRALRAKDETDRRIDYGALLRKAKPDIESELTDDVMRQRYDACQTNLRALGDLLTQARPDTIVVVGDDQHEQFHEGNMPMFSVYYGDSVQLRKESRRGHG